MRALNRLLKSDTSDDDDDEDDDAADGAPAAGSPWPLLGPGAAAVAGGRALAGAAAPP